MIDFETLGQVKVNQATSDELIIIKAHIESAADIPLDIPEQFLRDLSGISNFNERLECFMFQSRFADNLNEIENRLHNIKHVCDMLLNSTSMKQVFRYVEVHFFFTILTGFFTKIYCNVLNFFLCCYKNCHEFSGLKSPLVLQNAPNSSPRIIKSCVQ